MKKQYTLLALILCFVLPVSSMAQMVGDCVFLQAAHLEVGISPIGAYGSTQPAPASYHPDGAYSLWDPGSSTYASTRLLGFVADPAGDGWTTGTPAMFGDYFLPGTPQEGWSIQVNGVESDAWLQALSSSGSGYSGTLSGTNVSYTSAGGISTGVWLGTAAPLQIRQTTTLNASKYYFTVNVIIKNTGATTANNVYYQRTLDPDNAEQQYGTGDFTTHNAITYQLPNPSNKVMVSATAYSNTISYLGLGTKDCRAKCYMIDFGLTPSYTLDQVYNASTTYYYTVGSTYTMDAGIGLVYKLGNIAPGDSTSLTYAYVMRAADLDSALDVTAPTILANSTILTPGSDTVNACASGLDSIPITISNGGAYSWVWSPATGLSSTTGTAVTVYTDSLTGITTYTVIGTPLSGALCSNDTFHFTVIPGISAGPGVTPVYYCQYDTPDSLTAIGTNLLWYITATGGTGSPSAPTPSTTVPGVYTWWVSQHIGACGESIRVPITVTVTKRPYVIAGSNSPICSNQTLLLTATDTIASPPATYSWSGPSGYSTTVRNPSIAPGLAMPGWYYVTITVNGCSATDSTKVIVNPAPVITSITMTPPSACNVSDGTITLYGLTPLTTYTIFYTYDGGTPIDVVLTSNSAGQITITGLHAGIYSGIYVISPSGCTSNIVTITLPDGVAPAAPVATSNGPICADSTLYLFATDTATSAVYHWAGPNGFTSTLQNPVITGASTLASGIYYVTITLTTTGCVSAAGTVNVLVKPTPSVPVITSNSPVCAGSELDLHAVSTPAGSTFTWSGPASFTSSVANPVIASATTVNSGVYTVVATLSGCASLPATKNIVVNPIPPAPAAPGVTYCQYDASVSLTASGSDLWYTSATGGTGSPTAPIPGTSTAGITTYYVSQVVLGCESGRTPVDVIINPKPVVSITPGKSYICQHDTLTLTSTGTPALSGASYYWILPSGGTIIGGTDTSSSSIIATFDSGGNNPVSLTITANGCTTTNYYTVHVVPTPVTGMYIAPNICVGDTTILALTTISPGINTYTWNTDSTHLHIISAASGGGGPFSLSWDTAGYYIINLTAYSTQEECPSVTMHDTIDVHALPDASFTGAAPACTGDSVLFTATTSSYSDSYVWGPAAFFSGVINSPTVYGTILIPGYVTLTVTDAFGCHATDSVLYTPSECCIITLPEAFTPNNDGLNDYFRPITAGHHLLHDFRVVNRWGVTVFETTTTSTPGWDGTYGGTPQDMGTYNWYLKYTCGGHTLEKTGSVILIR